MYKSQLKSILMKIDLFINLCSNSPSPYFTDRELSKSCELSYLYNRFRTNNQEDPS